MLAFWFRDYTGDSIAVYSGLPTTGAVFIQLFTLIFINQFTITPLSLTGVICETCNQIGYMINNVLYCYYRYHCVQCICGNFILITSHISMLQFRATSILRRCAQLLYMYCQYRSYSTIPWYKVSRVHRGINYTLSLLILSYVTDLYLHYFNWCEDDLYLWTLEVS